MMKCVMYYHKIFFGGIPMAEIIFAGKKKLDFLNLIKVDQESDIFKFPADVQAAITIVGDSIRVESREYEEGEVIPFGAFIAWEPCTHDRCPHGYNLWNKSNAAEQLETGVLEQVGEKYRQTKIVPYKAQLFEGDIPEIFAEAPTFDGQVTVSDDTLKIETPWGTSSCKNREGFALVYGIYSDNEEKPEFRGMLNGNILTVGTPSFEDYYHVTEDGKIVETLREYFESLNG